MVGVSNNKTYFHTKHLLIKLNFNKYIQYKNNLFTFSIQKFKYYTISKISYITKYCLARIIQIHKEEIRLGLNTQLYKTQVGNKSWYKLHVAEVL